jgi:type I restriction enzyme S subunit
MSDSEGVCYRALSELVSQVDAKIIVRKDPARPYVGLENIPSRGAHLTGWSLASSSISTNSIFQAGDILFGKLRPNLRKCVVAPFDGYCSTDILVLRVNTGVDPSFAGKVMRTERVGAAAEMTSVGTKMPRTSWKQLSELEVFCPSFPEQSKIAEVLDILDTAIHETEAIITKLKAVKQGLLHDLLTRGIDANGELRPAQVEAPHLYKKLPLGWIPKEWDTDIVANLTTSSVIGPFGSDLVASDYRTTGVPVVFVRDIKPGSLIWKSNIYVGRRKAKALAAHEVVPGDVVATKMGLPPCVAAVYPGSMPNGIVTADIVRLRPNLDRIRPDWMSAFINTPAVTKQVEQITAGVTRPKVTLRDVRDLRLAVPSLPEQQKILDRIDAIEERIYLEEGGLRKLLAEKSGLMDDLLTGRVRVTPLLEGATP